MEAARRHVWIEVDDFIRTFDWSITPSGIDRVQMEIIPALKAAFPDQVSLFRLGAGPDRMEMLSFASLLRQIERNEFLVANSASRRMQVRLAQLLRVVATRVREFRDQHPRLGDGARNFRRRVRPGDVIVNFGATWVHPNYGESIRELKRRHGVKLALLVHDILPVTHPAHVSQGHIGNFLRWLADMAETWDLVMTPSRYSAQALSAHLAASGLAVPPIQPIPFGGGFQTRGRTSAKLPIGAEPFVLCVSTLEIRKNHALLLRIWKRLLAKHGAARVPKLVLAGKYGWEIDDLKQELHATSFLNGKVEVLSWLSDHQISSAYARCLFTVFPSLCEGWGLPVTESLSQGKLCIASNATSIPEAGGRFADYFSPTDEDDAFAAVERALFDGSYREAREREIARHYLRATWAGTAAAVMHLLESGQIERPIYATAIPKVA